VDVVPRGTAGRRINLDLRPGEPARSVSQAWLQCCATCGAVVLAVF
jgi:hypothetical protein